MNTYRDLSYLSSYNEDALREIIYDHSSEYEAITLETAKAELLSRYSDLFTDERGECLPFFYILRYSKMDDIVPSLRLYLHKKKTDLSPFHNVFNKLLSMEPSENNPIQLSAQKITDINKWTATGRNIRTGEEMDLSFLTWKEWLGICIPKELILRVGPERITALALYKMTINGFSETDTEKCIENLQKLSDTEFQPEDENTDTDENEYDENENVVKSTLQGSDFIAEGLLRIKENKKQKKKEKQEVHPLVALFRPNV